MKILLLLVILGSAALGLSKIDKHIENTRSATLYHYDSVKLASSYRFSPGDSGRPSAFARIIYPVFGDSRVNDLMENWVLSSVGAPRKFADHSVFTIPLPPGDDPVYQPAVSYLDLANNFIKTFESEAPDAIRQSYWYADIDVRVLSNSDSYLSCLCKADYYAGGLHDEYTYSYLNYDCRAHHPFSLEALIKPHRLSRLRTIVKRLWRQQEGTTAADPFDLTPNFTIDGHGLKFLYSPGELEPLAAGTTQITVPFQELKDLYRPHSILADIMKEDSSQKHK